LNHSFNVGIRDVKRFGFENDNRYYSSANDNQIYLLIYQFHNENNIKMRGQCPKKLNQVFV